MLQTNTKGVGRFVVAAVPFTWLIHPLNHGQVDMLKFQLGIPVGVFHISWIV
jgi:hypothetical protein